MSGCCAVGRSFVKILDSVRPQPEFGAKDGVNARTFCGLVELDGTVQIARVGKRHGIHLQLRHAADQFSGTHGAVENGVLAAVVKVNKSHDFVCLIRFGRGPIY